ncbi:MAG: inositol monophosphatase family protein [Telluria sp.]
MTNFTEISQAAEEVVREAGLMIRAAFQASDRPAYSLKGRQDYLTATDGAVESFVRQAICARFPDHAVMGEEAGGLTQAQHLWIVDPVDGTANFARQIPHCCISLGYLHNGAVQVGAIYDPMHDELFVAERGRGARLNGAIMQVSSVAELSAATIEIGWSTRTPESRYLDLVTRSVRAGCAVRRAGSGALGLAYVAAGRIEAYAEAHINSWDVAAGLLLVQEAGGRVNDFWTGDAIANGNPVLASNAALASEVSGLANIALNPIDNGVLHSKEAALR